MNNKSKLKIMATSLALSAASSGAWGVNAIANIDPCGCFLWKASTLPGALDGSFVPCGVPFITGRTFAFSRESTPLAILHFEKADVNGQGNMSNIEAGKDFDARKQRGLYRPDPYFRNSKVADVVKKAANGSSYHRIYMNAVIQPLPKSDLFFRPEIAIYNDINASGNLQNWCLDVADVLIDGISHPELAVNRRIGSVPFNNINFTEEAHGDLKIFDAEQLNNKSHVSFWTVLKTPGAEDKKSPAQRIFVTHHWLIKESLAATIRRHLQCLRLSLLYGGHVEQFSAIYNTDTVARANFLALCKELHIDCPRSDAASEQLNQAWQVLINNYGFMRNAFLSNGLAALLADFFWRLKDNGEASFKDKNNAANGENAKIIRGHLLGGDQAIGVGRISG